MAKKKQKNKTTVLSAEKEDLEKLISQEENSIDVQTKTADINPDELNDDSREEDQSADLEAVKEITDDELQKELKRFLIPKLRSASYRWSERSKAIRNARIARGIYECASCLGHFKNGEFIVDHISPVVPLEGWDGVNWTQYVTRMFVKAEGFQILCKTCSTIKTDTEVQLRKLYRENKKKK